ncbi:hypothetical protein OFP00_38395, partial [Escherichia coli]|nr:hypothetical protein [Escherichia coli]
KALVSKERKSTSARAAAVSNVRLFCRHKLRHASLMSIRFSPLSFVRLYRKLITQGFHLLLREKVIIYIEVKLCLMRGKNG